MRMLKRISTILVVLLVGGVGYMAWRQSNKPDINDPPADPELRALQTACNDQLAAGKRAAPRGDPNSRQPGTAPGDAGAAPQPQARSQPASPGRPDAQADQPQQRISNYAEAARRRGANDDPCKAYFAKLRERR